MKSTPLLTTLVFGAFLLTGGSNQLAAQPTRILCPTGCTEPIQETSTRFVISIPGCDKFIVEAAVYFQECGDEVNIWTMGFRNASVSGISLNSPECLAAYQNFIQPGGGPVNKDNYNHLLNLLADRFSIWHFRKNYASTERYGKYVCPESFVTHNFIRSLCSRGVGRYETKPDGTRVLVEARTIECDEDCCIQKRTICYTLPGPFDVSVEPKLTITDERPVPTGDPRGCGNKNPENPPGWVPLFECQSSCRPVSRIEGDVSLDNAE